MMKLTYRHAFPFLCLLLFAAPGWAGHSSPRHKKINVSPLSPAPLPAYSAAKTVDDLQLVTESKFGLKPGDKIRSFSQNLGEMSVKGFKPAQNLIVATNNKEFPPHDIYVNRQTHFELVSEYPDVKEGQEQGIISSAAEQPMFGNYHKWNNVEDRGNHFQRRVDYSPSAWLRIHSTPLLNGSRAFVLHPRKKVILPVIVRGSTSQQLNTPLNVVVEVVGSHFMMEVSKKELFMHFGQCANSFYVGDIVAETNGFCWGRVMGCNESNQAIIAQNLNENNLRLATLLQLATFNINDEQFKHGAHAREPSGGTVAILGTQIGANNQKQVLIGNPDLNGVVYYFPQEKLTLLEEAVDSDPFS